MAACAVSVAGDRWTVRGYEPSDRDGMRSLLSFAYTRSRAGYRAGASRQGVKAGPPTDDDYEKRRAFIDSHEPIWDWLLQHADVSMVVDSASPQIIWAWAVISEPNIVHAVGCKTSFCERIPG